MGNANSGPPKNPRRNMMLIEEHRKKIKTTKLVNALTNHVVENTEMSSTQVTAALGLLRKVLPDMKEVEHLGEVAVTRAVYYDPTSHLEEQDGKTIQ